MASVGIGYKPLQRQKTEFFELPFNELLAGLSAKQKQFDEVDDTKNQMFDALLKVKPFYESDKQYVQQVQNKLSSNVDNIINKYQGDLTKARPEIQKLAREINQELTTGNLATVNYNTTEAAKIMEDVAKARQDKEFGQYSEVIGQVPNFYQRQQMQLQDALDEQGNLKRLGFSGIHRQANQEVETNNLFTDIKADAVQNKLYDWNTGKWRDSGTESITKGKIYSTALNAVNTGLLTPNFQAELDYMTNNMSKEQLQNQANNFLNKMPYNVKEQLMKAYPDYNDNLALLKQFAKANHIGAQGERFAFDKSKYSEGIDMAYVKGLMEEEEKRKASQLQSFNNPIEAGEEIKTEFDNIKFDKGKVLNKKETTSLTSSGTVGPGIPTLGNKNVTAETISTLTPEEEIKFDGFIKTLRSQFSELGKTNAQGMPVYNNEQVYNTWKEAKKNSAQYYNKTYNFKDDALNKNQAATIDRVLDTQPAYVLGTGKIDLTFDKMLKDLGKTKEDFKKEAKFAGFNFADERFPGALEYRIGDKRVLIGGSNEFSNVFELGQNLTKGIKTAVGSGEPQTFNFGGASYTVFPELVKNNNKWEFKPIIRMSDSTGIEDMLPEQIYENLKTIAEQEALKK